MRCSECRLCINNKCYSSSRASKIAQDTVQAVDIMIYANYTDTLSTGECKYGIKKGVKEYEKITA
jgi:hypothetical protein